MSIQPLVILEPTDSGGTSTTFEVVDSPVVVRLSGSGAVLGSGETATLQYSDAIGEWHDMSDPVSGPAVITDGDTAMKVSATGLYRIVLTGTAGPLVGIEIVGSFRG